jgi:hypothetical protein
MVLVVSHNVTISVSSIITMAYSIALRYDHLLYYRRISVEVAYQDWSIFRVSQVSYKAVLYIICYTKV